MAGKKSKILNTTVCIIYMLFGFAFAEAPQPGTVLACELYPDVHPRTIDTTGSFNQLVAIWENLIGKTYISEEQILKYIQEAPLPFNFELSINHSVVIKGNHTNFQIERSSFVIKASELYQLDIQAAIEKEKELTESFNVATEEKKKLEEQIETLEKKCSDSKAEYAEKVAELESKLEEFRKKASTLEISLQAALKSSGDKLSEAETLVEVLRNDLQAAGLRESEIMEKLKSVEDQLKHVNSKKSELEARIAEVEEKLSIRDSEVNELNEKLIALEGQLLEVSTVAETRKIELEETLEKLKNLESIVDELKTKPSAKKDETYEQLQTSKKIASLEENNLLNEKLKEAKENLNAKISEKSNRVKELEQQLVKVEIQLKQEVESVKADFAEKVREGDVLKEKLLKLQKKLETECNAPSLFMRFVSAIIRKIIFW